MQETNRIKRLPEIDCLVTSEYVKQQQREALLKSGTESLCHNMFSRSQKNKKKKNNYAVLGIKW